MIGPTSLRSWSAGSGAGEVPIRRLHGGSLNGPRGELYTAAAAVDRLLVRSLASSHFSCLAQLDNNFVFDQTLIVWTLPIQSGFALLTSRVHETWTLFLGATLEDRGRYNIEDCFRNFPFPTNFDTHPALEKIGREYHNFRAQLIIDRQE